MERSTNTELDKAGTLLLLERSFLYRSAFNDDGGDATPESAELAREVAGLADGALEAIERAGKASTPV